MECRGKLNGRRYLGRYCYLRPLHFPHLRHAGAGGNEPGPGAEAIQRDIYPMLCDPDAIRHYMEEPWGVPGQ